MENVNNKDSKRKTIILTTIGLITLISLVIGATYAFLNVTGTNSSTPTNVTGSTEGLGGAALANPTPKLHINLQATDMNAANKGMSYYATNDESKNYDTEETKRSIAIASVSGGQADTKNQCESTLTIDISGTMKDELVSGDGKIVLSPTSGVEMDTTEIDLKDLADKTSITIPVVYKITGSTEERIEAIMLINNTENDQINLAGKEININITNTSFKCEVVSEFTKDTTIADIIESNPTNLNATTEEIDELAYRYQGTAEQVTNNYICFGTTSKEECTSTEGHDKNMYRIIGVTKDGKMKIIKKEDTNNKYSWGDGVGYTTEDIKWPNSVLYNDLNGSIFLGNIEYVPNNWLDKIDNHNWKYGDIDDTGANQSAQKVLNIEQSWNDVINAKIGLMYLADYYYSGKKEGTNCKNYSENCSASWLHIHNNDILTEEEEYILPRYGFNSTTSRYVTWIIGRNPGGAVTYPIIPSTMSIRPVFYLTSDTKISSGTGTIDDPYTIKL